MTELALCLDGLVTYAEGLVLHFNASEPHFLKIADILEQIAEDISVAHNNSQKLVDAESGILEKENVVLLSMSLIRESLQEAEGLNREISETIHGLKQLDGMADLVLQNETHLKAAIAPFTIVRMLFKIHSAPLCEEDRTIFANLSDELEKLDQSVRKVFLDQFRNLHSLRTTLVRVLPDIQRETARVQSSLSQQQRQMDKTLNLLDQQIAGSKQTTLLLNQESKELQLQFSQLIMGSQFHDIIRQRLEHVLQAARQMQSEVTNHSTESSVDEWENLGHFLKTATEIQKQQIDTLFNRLCESEQTIESGVRGLVKTSGKVAAEAVRSHDRDGESSQIDKVIEALFALFDSLSKVLATSRVSANSAHRAVFPLKSMVSDLTGVLSSISTDIRLIALNSQVKAAQINEGTGLDVLSTKTREISTDILSLNTHLASDLENLSTTFSKSFLALEQCAEKIDLSSTRLLEKVEKSTHALDRLKKFIATLVQPIIKSHGSVDQACQKIISELQFRDKLSADIVKLPEVIRDLQQISQKLSGLGPGREFPSVRLDSLRKNYTMAEEHSVHNRVAGVSSADEPTAAASAQTSTSSTADFPVGNDPVFLGDNIEMF